MRLGVGSAGPPSLSALAARFFSAKSHVFVVGWRVGGRGLGREALVFFIFFDDLFKGLGDILLLGGCPDQESNVVDDSFTELQQQIQGRDLDNSTAIDGKQV